MARTGRRARVGAAVALSLSLALAGCGGGTSKAAKPTATPKPQVSVPVVSKDHSMPQPPRLVGGNAQADILIYASKALSPDMVKKIQAIRAGKQKVVTATELFSLASPSIQGQTYNVAAVDPATYRRFSPAGQQAEIWSRLAAGEMVVASKAAAEQVQSEPNFISIGTGDDARSVHIGAYAPEPPLIQLVVNAKWGEDLFDVHDNALLISTGTHTPQSIRKQVEAIVKGTGASIQLIDKATRLGLDPSAVQTAVATGGSIGAEIGTYHYRVMGTQVIPDSSWVAAHIRTEVMPIVGTVSCDKVMLLQLRQALNELIQRGLDKYIHTTAGCFNARFIAGTTSLSNHAFGMAIDFDAPQNARGTAGQIPPAVVQVFKDWGFAWGGDWHYTDPMHFELARIMKVV